MKQIAITISNNNVVSRLNASEKLMLVTIDRGKINSERLVPLKGKDPLRIIDIIFQLKPDILICGGLTKLCEYKLGHSNIKLISWIQGNVEYILSLCLKNTLIEGYNYKGDYKSSHRSYA